MPSEPVKSLAAAEPYVTEFEADVHAIDGREVILEQTYFYPEGGGQPADKGTLGGIDVLDVQTRADHPVHTLSEAPDFDTGESVTGRVDEAFRTYCMRAHTASHLVYGAGRRLFDPDGYDGFDIGEETARLDFETDDADRVDGLELQRLASEAVWESRPVRWHEMDTEAARADEAVVFNLGTDAVGETVRIVDIEGWDISACGGTHVANTREVGPITVLDVSNPGAGAVRVEFAVGPTAIAREIAHTRQARRTAAALDTTVADLPERARSLTETVESLEAELHRLRRARLTDRLRDLADRPVRRDGAEWLVGTVEAADSNAVADALEDFDGDLADVAVLVGEDGATFVVVASVGDPAAGDIIDEVTSEFGGGGGGGPTLAQGGGLDADPESVVASLRDGEA